MTEERCTVIHGDALRIIPSLERSSVDLIVTDPPYSSGGMTRGDRMSSTKTKYLNSDSGNLDAVDDFDGDTRDQRSFGYWSTLWLAALLGVAKPGAMCLVFIDWRQLPTLTDAFQAAGWVWRGLVPWNKTEATRPQLGRPRQQCEYIVWGSRGPHRPFPGATVLPGFFEIATERERFHVAQKPLALMLELVTLAPPDGLVLDAFAGSGTTGIAALRNGRRALLIESNDSIVTLLRERVAAELNGHSLAHERAGQLTLVEAP